MARRWLVFASVWLLAGPVEAADPTATSCVICHSDPAFGAEVELSQQDVHARAALSCQDCHGGNPDPRLAADAAAAMDPEFESNPFIGAPGRGAVPGFCGRCHSDPEYMRRFNPGARVDQEEEYWTSFHGLALRQGDANVATCVDCHGVHAILAIDDPESPVFPRRVAETCGRCHADPRRMQGYTLPDGRPLPVDQYALWRQSVHAAALKERDLSAPTCNDCHGNHGAAPPQVESVAQICGQCHRREAQLFQHSEKIAGFRRHNEFLASVGDAGCAACHVAPEPQAAVTDVTAFGECATCHGNHAIVRPTVAMLAPLPDTPCAFCHEGPAPHWEEVWGREIAAAHYRTVRDGLLATAATLNLDGDERFDWLVDAAHTLPFHRLRAGASSQGTEPALRPEFERLFRKFRIGKTHFEYRDPVTGKREQARIRSCDVCHAAEPLLAAAPRGLETAGELLSSMRELSAVTAMAERTLLRARRGGVDVTQAPTEIDESVDAEVSLQVLVHHFSVDPAGAFVRKRTEGLEHAKTALSMARQALEELGERRRGLVAFLIAVAFVLVALALKIRQISAREQDDASRA